MKLPRFSIRRVLLLGGALLIVAGVIAPYLSADRFGERIRTALEQSLGRRVEMENVRFNLFRGPGFSVRKVVIHEDPAIGIEPFAYVASLETRVSLRSIWTGRLEFSSLRFVEPSVNLVKVPAGPWNFQPLLTRAAGADLPEIHMRGGRLNFKFGDSKSVFYFSDTDLDIEPPSRPGGSFDVGFSGEPSRTDRAMLAFGKLTGRGRWQPSRNASGRLQLDLNLERSAIGELVALIHGQDIGLHGRVAARARIQGPVSSLGIEGVLQLEDIHRWDLMPPYAEGGPLNYHGRLDLLSQSLELETVPAENSALSVQFQAKDYLTEPRWALSLSLNQLPAKPALDVARHMGAPIPQAVGIEGGIVGVIGYSPDDGFHGRSSLQDALITAPGAPPMRLEEAQLLLAGDRFQVASAVLRTNAGEAARVQAEYLLSDRRLDLRISTDEFSIDGGRQYAGSLLGMARPPFLESFRGGVWKGSLRYRREGESPGVWSGALVLRDTRMALQGMADPLEVAAARVNLKSDRVVMNEIRAKLGKAEIEGEYVHEPGAKRPDQWRCRVKELEAAELERLLMPTLRRPRGFLSRTLGLGRGSLPAWLRQRHTEGVLEIGELSLPEIRFEGLKARVFWDGADLSVTHLVARLQGGQARGHFSVNLQGPQPAYEVGGRIQSANWRGGQVDADVLLRTGGTGTDLLWNLRGEGSFSGHSIALGPDLRPMSVSGDWEVAWRRNVPVLDIRSLRLVTSRGVFVGQGALQPDGQLQVQLSGGEAEMRLAGSLVPLELQVLETP